MRLLLTQHSFAAAVGFLLRCSHASWKRPFEVTGLDGFRIDLSPHRVRVHRSRKLL